MKGAIKIVVLIVIALASFAGYTVLFSIISGLKPAQAFSLKSKPKTEQKTAADTNAASGNQANQSSAASDSTAVSLSDSSKTQAISDSTRATLDSLQIQLNQIKTEKAQLEKLKSDIAQLLKTKNKADSLQLYGLAKMYDGVDPAQVALMMANMNDSLVTEILPCLKSQKAGKILQSMPPERAAKISSKLLGIN